MPSTTIDIAPVLRGRGDRGPTYYEGDEPLPALTVTAKGSQGLSGTASATYS